MTYAAYENSVQSGTPIELYEFVQGTQRWSYISRAEELVRLGQVYTPAPIKRDRVKQSTDVFKNSMRLTFPRDNEFAVQFLGFAPDSVTTVAILRGHANDPDQQFIIYWKGRVLSAKATESQIEIECEPLYTSIRRPGLRAKFEYSCRHVLYRRGCFVNQEAFLHEGAVLSVSGGLNVEVAGAAALGATWFVGGMIVAEDGASRFIVGQPSAGVVTMSRPMPSVVGGSTVKLYPGCDHLRGTCDTKFNNLDNFGGFPWIPSRNPFDGSSIA